MTDDTVCPCGSGLSFALCCGPALSGQRPAETAEALMRSRYTAYVRGDVGYLKASWHPSTCPPDLSLDNQPVWEKLEIVRCEAGGVADEEGRVEFIAHFRDKTGSGRVPELSRFVREQGSWFYLDGVQPPTLVNKTGRNAPCPCGSGRKFKQCCGR